MHRCCICILFHSLLVVCIATGCVQLWLERRGCWSELSTLDVEVAGVGGLVLGESLRDWLEWWLTAVVVLSLALVGWFRLMLLGLVGVVGGEVAGVLGALREVGHVRGRPLGHRVADWDVENVRIGLVELHQDLLPMLDLHK